VIIHSSVGGQNQASHMPLSLLAMQQKQRREQAAMRIQQHYRIYKNRNRHQELNRAALFIQQMYRYVVCLITSPLWLGRERG